MLLATAPVGMLPLAGCDATLNTTEANTNEDVPYDQSSKLDGYYQVINSYDLTAFKRDYAELNAGKAKAGDSLSLSTWELEGLLRDMQQARTAEGSLGNVDALADRLLPRLKQLNERAKGLDSYFTMRGYLTDGYARARREDSPMLAHYDAAIAAYIPLATAVEEAKAREEVVTARRMQAEGRMNIYQDILIARHVRAIKAATPTIEAVKDPAATAHADQLIAELAPLLDKDRAAWKKVPLDDRPMNESLVIAAEQLIGAYREYRETGNAHDFVLFRRAVSGVLMNAP